MAVHGAGGVEGNNQNRFGTALGNVEVASSSDAVAQQVNGSIMVGTFFDINLTQFMAYIVYVLPEIYESTCILAQFRQTRYSTCKSKVPKTAYRAF